MASSKLCLVFLLAALLVADHADAQFNPERQLLEQNDTTNDTSTTSSLPLAENGTTSTTSTPAGAAAKESAGNGDTAVIILSVIGGLVGIILIVLGIFAYTQARAAGLYTHRQDIRKLDAGVAAFEEHLQATEKQVDNFNHHADEDKAQAGLHSELRAAFQKRFDTFKKVNSDFLQRKYEPEFKKRKDAKAAKEHERKCRRAAEQKREKAKEKKSRAAHRKKLEARQKALKKEIAKQQQQQQKPNHQMKDELLAVENQLRELTEIDEEADMGAPLVHNMTYSERIDEDDDADGCCGGARPKTPHREIKHQLEELKKLRANLDVIHADFKSMRDKVFPDGLPGAEELHLVMPGFVHEGSPGRGRGQGKFGGYVDDQVKLLQAFHHPLLEGVQVKPYGVLGSRDREKDPEPLTPIDAVVVDPAGWNFIGRSNSIRGAGGASKSIYHWLNLARGPLMGRFPQEVSRHFSTSLEKEAETRAKLFCYGQGQVVIHTIGPKLRDVQPGVQSLALTYLNVFSEFCQGLNSSSPSSPQATGKTGSNPDQPANAKSAGIPSTLRLCPISSGIFCEDRRLQPHMAEITFAAISLAMAMMPKNLQAVLREATIEVCVFQASELPAFEQALKQRKTQVQAPMKLGQDMGGVAGRESGWDGPSFDWVRKQNGPEDRLQRLNAFLLTAQAMATGGYQLPDGRLAKLDLGELLRGTRVLRSEASPAGVAEPLANVAEANGSRSESPAGQLPQVVVDKDGLTVLEVAAKIQRTGRSAAGVNAASAYSVGGGVLSGGRHALEESCCITSTLLPSLQQVHWDELQAMQKARSSKAPGSRWHAPPVEETPHMHVPVDGCIVSPAVEVFREASTKGYKFLEAPVRLAGVCSVAMFNMNPRVSDSPCDAPRDFQTYCDQVKQKFRAVVAGAVQLNAEVLVCPDVGCGVFANDPKVLGMLFGEVLREPVASKLKEVVLTGQVAFSEAVKRACAGEKVDVPTPAYFASVIGHSGASWYSGGGRGHGGGGGVGGGGGGGWNAGPRGGAGKGQGRGQQQPQSQQPTVVVASTALAADPTEVVPGSADEQHQPLTMARDYSPIPTHVQTAEATPAAAPATANPATASATVM
eukprot:TRINITY_DN2170_c3_g1_i1.p1 TRINITY_DN2170_c3_g1~~TRINITY_DN2170_c3_g1_i1.p1  ORF type:complete len:1105 (+),score=261.13 TRINITY_DN2170_c3_g1_i1:75-3389(+)